MFKREHSEKGSGFLEYMLLALLITVVCVSGVKAVGLSTDAGFQNCTMKTAFGGNCTP